MSDLFLLFATAFLAATVIPAQSEIVLATVYLGGAHSAALLVCVATLGNVLGSCLNWGIGRGILHFRGRSWFALSEATLARATEHFNRFGVWALLFSWVPFIGDPLTVAAGVLRTPFWLFVLLVTIGKAARYVALVALL